MRCARGLSPWGCSRRWRRRCTRFRADGWILTWCRAAFRTILSGWASKAATKPATKGRRNLSRPAASCGPSRGRWISTAIITGCGMLIAPRNQGRRGRGFTWAGHRRGRWGCRGGRRMCICRGSSRWRIRRSGRQRRRRNSGRRAGRRNWGCGAIWWCGIPRRRRGRRRRS